MSHDTDPRAPLAPAASFDTDRLYRLLPAILRARDEERGGPLRALLDVVAEQIAILEENIEQLGDDQFLETCAPWVLPYIGDLLGITGLPGAPLASRAEVGNTIAYRRRKGTAAVLELLARDIFGLPARAVEYFQLLATTQHLNHLRPGNQGILSIRNARRLEQLGGAFERLEGEADLTHTAEVRRIPPRRGRYNIPNIGIFVWRLRAYPLTRSPAVPDAPGDPRRFRFSPLGADAPLFRRPRTEAEQTQLAQPVNVPMPISRRALAAALEDDYGDDRSFRIERPPAAPGGEPVAVDAADIVVCDLSAWTLPPPGMVAVDPVLGRIAFGDDQPAPPLVSFHHGFSADIGGGEYDRRLRADEAAAVVTVSRQRPADHTTIHDALAALGTAGGIVEILDSDRYEEPISIAAGSARVTLRAADGFRPTIVPAGALEIAGDADAVVTLDGLLITGAAVEVRADGAGAGLGRLRLRHCTLVPGLALTADGAPASPAAPSLVVRTPTTQVELEACITGGVRAVIDARVAATGTIIDATAETGVAYAAPDGESAGAPLRLDACTVFGKIHADALEYVSNSILVAAAAATDDPAIWRAPIQARRRQEGCIRFSYLRPGALAPRRFRCQPDGATAAAGVLPVFTSMRYGAPGYAQLALATPDAIRRGADDESEMGAFHDTYLPLREAHARTRLNEYLRFGQEAGLFYAT
ncbi:MAG TPA: hypothetical protein VF158_05320 [Longimicrobiales bacterium]